MGVPHLITYLRPYADWHSLDGQNVVIDGPGLAYHIYYICCCSRPAAQSSFEALPSYRELGDAVILWLDGLDDHGVTVKRLYFDGFLPAAKFQVRLNRLLRSTQQMLDYYQSHSGPILYRARFNARKDGTPSVFRSDTVRSFPMKLPPLPFLVPAVLEMLNASEKYQRLTEVVPGEADMYCGQYVRKHGGIVMTGDSDLLLHDLGQDGAVSFFKDIEESSDGDAEHLRSALYTPLAIAERLALPEAHRLHTLAFEIVVDSHITFKKLLVQAVSLQAITKHRAMYDDFRKEYMPLPSNDISRGACEVDGSAERSVVPRALLQGLDPRISEFVTQFPYIAKIAGQPECTAKQEVIHVFLPFLIECPVRTNAWEMATPIRLLAYSLINLVIPEDEQQCSVIEHRKQHKDGGGQEWQLPSGSDTIEACDGIAALLEKSTKEDSGVSDVEIWTTIAVHQCSEWSHSHAKPDISSIVTEEIAGRMDDSILSSGCSWNTIHFLAVVQGSLYSFRILKQILSLVLSLKDREDLQQSLYVIHQKLESLPDLCDIPSLDQVVQILHKMGKTGVLSTPGLGPNAPPAHEPRILSKKAKKKRKKSKNGVTSATRPNNRFEVLGHR